MCMYIYIHIYIVHIHVYNGKYVDVISRRGSVMFDLRHLKCFSNRLVSVYVCAYCALIDTILWGSSFKGRIVINRSSRASIESVC